MNALQELAGVRDTLIVAANNPVAHGGLAGLLRLIRTQAERIEVALKQWRDPAIDTADLQAVLDLLAIMHADSGQYAATHGIAKAAKDALRPGTPAAAWRASGMPDPHGDLYNCERADLTMGNYTDDELANAAFLYGDRKLTPEQILAGEITSIAILTAAKDRIRWLSRKLVEAQAKARPMPVVNSPVMVRQLPETAEARDMQEIVAETNSGDPALRCELPPPGPGMVPPNTPHEVG